LNQVAGLGDRLSAAADTSRATEVALPSTSPAPALAFSHMALPCSSLSGILVSAEALSAMSAAVSLIFPATSLTIFSPSTSSCDLSRSGMLAPHRRRRVLAAQAFGRLVWRRERSAGSFRRTPRPRVRKIGKSQLGAIAARCFINCKSLRT